MHYRKTRQAGQSLAMAMLCIAMPAAGQISPTERKALTTEGFTPADLRLFEITEVAPSYRPFSAWRDCVRSTTEPTIRQKSVAETQAIVFELCREEQATAQSVIAAKSNLPTATRVMAIARSIEVRRMQALYETLNPPRTAGSSKIAGWEVQLSTTTCRAAIATDDLFAPGAIVLDAQAAQPTPRIFFVLGGDVMRAALQPPIATKIQTSLSSFQGTSARRLGSMQLTLGKIGGELAFNGVPSVAQFDVLKTGSSIQINGGLSRPVTLQTPEVDRVWNALQQCAASMRST